MQYWDVLLLAFAVAVDAFAVSVTGGMANHKNPWRHAWMAGSFFGAFQFLMAVTGWSVGAFARNWVESFGHWIAFAILIGIGVSMIFSACSVSEKEARKLQTDIFHCRMMLALAFATSLDALAAGASHSLLGQAILLSALSMGIVTFFCSAAGVWAGVLCGKRFDAENAKIEIAGGLAIIFIGCKILVEHFISQT